VDGPVEAPWDACLALAWEAHRAGSIPIGAVVVDGAGRIVARGRNRIYEQPGHGLSGSRLAHAEVDALSQLPLGDRPRDHVVYSSLEPCLLCVGAALIGVVGGIRYLAPDPVAGACTGQISTPHFLRRGLDIAGPGDGEAAALAAALAVSFWLDKPEEAHVLARWTDAPVEAAARINALADPPDRFEEALPRLLECL
jgi:tRNA(adenine34) deaminase